MEFNLSSARHTAAASLPFYRRTCCITLLAIALASGAVSRCGIHSVKEGQSEIEQRFQKTVKNSKHSKTAALLLHSDKLSLHVTSAAGSAGGLPAVAEQPFHAASVGKLFTAVLVLQYIEQGKLKLHEPVYKTLGIEKLKQLFVFEGNDYAEQVTIAHLLAHTSGIDDYFESKNPKSKSVLAEITNNPSQFWKPADLVEFTRKNQKALGKPGDVFHYSDTGYILLGLLLEKISGKSFENLLHEKIFDPLGMKNSYMHLRSTPKNKRYLPLSTMMLGDKDVTTFRSVSADWAGGGIITTTEDLLLFHRALVSGKLISPATYASMQGTAKFLEGIYYGLGMMTVKFGEMSVIMPKTPDLHGHSGLLSTLMFYSPEYDAHIIANLGSTEDIADTFEMMFWFMRTLKEMNALKK